jgi:HK97 family phage portal protein
MSILDIFRRQDAQPERAPVVQVKGSQSWGGGRGYSAGDSFTRDVDMSSSAYRIPYLPVREGDARNSSIVASVVGWAMRNVVQVQPVTQTENSEGLWEPIPKHGATMLIAKPQGQINPDERTAMNYRRMLRALAWSLMMDGNGYVLKVRNGSRPIGLDWLPHGSVNPIERRGYPTIIDEYELRSASGTRLVPRSDMVHVTLGIDPDRPACGCSPLKAVMRLVMTDNQIAVFSHAVLRNPFPGIVLSPKADRMLASDLTVMVDQLQQIASGERGGGVAAFSDPMDVEKLGYSPDDMAVRELAKLPEERISAVFGIPAIVCGLGAGLERSTFANFEQAREAATEEFLVPLWGDIAEAFTDQLLPEFGNPANQRIIFDYSDVKSLQEDTDALHVRVREDFKANIIDRAQAKAALGAQPGPEDEGVYWYQLRPSPAFDVLPHSAGGKARSLAEGMV